MTFLASPSATITHGDWTLVFRAQRRIGVSAYNTWTNSQATTDSPVLDTFPHACLRLNYYGSCNRHFRSHIIDRWENIDKVKLSLISRDVQVAYILFNGTGSNNKSWFSQERILSSTWPNLASDNGLAIFNLFG
ncbi:hypothetical protein PoB_004208500 [Plakobranchus ocellatus]|uniref:Uncharacterized protein n=1 Tax=Plakobranchus ocellatus TaxID=259542 RepID=A0AAV4B4R2_9GAST|nr:hypothetical protein PoB_004208500 [Plakobranchus ocellatus]